MLCVIAKIIFKNIPFRIVEKRDDNSTHDPFIISFEQTSSHV